MLLSKSASFVLFLLSHVHASSVTTKKQYFTTTSVFSNSSADDSAAFQCWRRTAAFNSYPTVGSSLSLANLTDAAIVSLPAGSKEGLHKPPRPMLFVLLRGSARVTLPSAPNESGLIIDSGTAIIAIDTTGEGHWTEYGEYEDALALQLFLDEGWKDDWEALHDGPCNLEQSTRWTQSVQQNVIGWT